MIIPEFFFIDVEVKMFDEKVLFIGDRSYWSNLAADFLSSIF